MTGVVAATALPKPGADLRDDLVRYPARGGVELDGPLAVGPGAFAVTGGPARSGAEVQRAAAVFGGRVSKAGWLVALVRAGKASAARPS